MISSIQLSQETKELLKEQKISRLESYEKVIRRLIQNQHSQEEELKQGYLAQAEELKKVHEEWSDADSAW